MDLKETLSTEQEILSKNLFEAINTIPKKHLPEVYSYISGMTMTINGLGNLFKEVENDKRAS